MLLRPPDSSSASETGTVLCSARPHRVLGEWSTDRFGITFPNGAWVVKSANTEDLIVIEHRSGKPCA
jgi:hypothetical protein